MKIPTETFPLCDSLLLENVKQATNVPNDAAGKQSPSLFSYSWSKQMNYTCNKPMSSRPSISLKNSSFLCNKLPAMLSQTTCKLYFSLWEAACQATLVRDQENSSSKLSLPLTNHPTKLSLPVRNHPPSCHCPWQIIFQAVTASDKSPSKLSLSLTNYPLSCHCLWRIILQVMTASDKSSSKL